MISYDACNFECTARRATWPCARIDHTAKKWRRAGRHFVKGRLQGLDVVLALSGIGKVAAATTTTTLIEHFGVETLVFTGVAGGIGTGVQVGDVVVAQHFVQHDMDVRPLLPRWQVPGYPHPTFHCHPALTERLHQAALDCTRTAAHWNEPLLQGRAPAAHAGPDCQWRPIHCLCQAFPRRMHGDFQGRRPHALAVEMEGAAIAQVCADYGIAFAAVRTISDRADDAAHVDFPAFVSAVASRYALHIVAQFLSSERV